MNEYDDMDIEELVNNPFRNIDTSGGNTSAYTDRAEEKKHRGTLPVDSTFGGKPASEEHMEQNHPTQERLLAFEKNFLITDKNIETLITIIEEQNERIRKLEEELAILREHLPGK